MKKVKRPTLLVLAFLFLILPTEMVVSEDAPAAGEPLCGPGVFTIGDAWEVIQLQSSQAQNIIASRDLTRLPQNLAAIRSHTQFIQRGAIMIFGKRRIQLNQTMKAMEDLHNQLVSAALANDDARAADLWKELDASLKFMTSLLPDEALLPSTSFAHLLPPASPTLHVQIEPLPSLEPGKPLRVTFQLVRLDNLQPIDSADLFVTHGAALHALICDRTLTDYQHEHPTSTGKPGEWEFTFTPKFNDQYVLWINAVPTQTGREEFDTNLLSVQDLNVLPRQPDFQPNLTNQTANLRGTIHWDGTGKVAVDRPISGRLQLAELDGTAVSDLEPYMGAFAHIVGISEDVRTILHVHPDGSNNGPDIPFTLRPTQRGFYRLFVQVKRANTLLTIPFGFTVD